ncbi:aldose 1-epimerase family protein [Corynebacterium anserum]|uniref:Aldose epimerase n=1 Tax=Corynebacterium anserum TaxID=2684406 RepID=A0A7G7YM13_9CORY|nr:aldose 1-epimerase family protein [Corynebacterium anserum]MBC2681291.1 aldose epimerase [Corynebacterium anserum]QNH95533.1 aldose epimerase [Corynebacterium anserum]
MIVPAGVENTHDFVELSAGDYRASVSTFGGGTRMLTYRGRSLLTGFEVGQFPPLSSGTLLAPWPNRTAEGVFSHDGELYSLEITEPGRATAIHGFVATSVWEVEQRSGSAVVLRLNSERRQGWPWPLEMRVRWSLDAATGLRAEFSVVNRADSSCPFGLGWHPYLSAHGAALEECTVFLPVRTNLPLDGVRNLPAGPEIPAVKILPTVDQGVQMAGVWLDHCFGEVERTEGKSEKKGCEVAKGVDTNTGERLGDVPRSTVVLTNAQGDGVQLWADEQFGWYQVFTADPARREGYPGVGRALAVEPMTCPPNALRSGVDLLRLDAEEERYFTFGVSNYSA